MNHVGTGPEADHEVLVAGGGPTGLMLGAELALAGVDVAIVERRAGQDLVGSRAGGLHARTIEMLDQRGVAQRFLEQGQLAQVAGFCGVRLDISDFPTRHNYGLALWQRHIERTLAGWVDELGVRIYRDREVTGATQDQAGVDLQVAGGGSLRAEYVVGCDGGRSIVRKAAGIEFAGWDATTSCLIAEVVVTGDPDWGVVRRDAVGIHGFTRLSDSGQARVVVTERHVGTGREPTVGDLSAALIDIYGTDYGVHRPSSIARFTDTARQATAYRHGRILLAGDAAHIHDPVGGQGLNTGVQDAVNLGWKLAQVVKGTSPASLLDTYHDERHPVAARVLRDTMAQVALRRVDDRTQALIDSIAELMTMDEPRKRIAGTMSGLGITYSLTPYPAHPLVGRRMPDLDLVTAAGPRRVFDYLHTARPVLVNLSGAPLPVTGWSDRVQFVDADYGGVWELPVIGDVAAPAAVLIRPDGYVAWAGQAADPELVSALTRWFGPPAQHTTTANTTTANTTTQNTTPQNTTPQKTT